MGSMELTYPINLNGFEDDATSGDVLTRYGEYLGTWAFVTDEENETGVFHFTVDDTNEPMFSEGVGVLSSGMLTGMAMSKLCSSIRDWHEDPT
tara:strand:- start:668 stop:946 length:279 start_codon:yes stop_codon:yes gene_type:complete